MKEKRKLFERLAIDDEYAGIIWSTVKLKSVDILNEGSDIFRVTYEFNTVENKVGTIVFPNIVIGLKFKDIEEEIDEYDVTAGIKNSTHSFFRTYNIEGSWQALSGNAFIKDSDDGYFIVNMPK